MLKHCGGSVDKRPVKKCLPRVVLHLDDSPASVMHFAVDIKTGVFQFPHWDGYVPRQIFQTLDVQIGKKLVEDAKEKILVCFGSKQVLETPVRGRVDEPLVLVIDEMAVFSCHSSVCKECLTNRQAKEPPAPLLFTPKNKRDAGWHPDSPAPVPRENGNG